MLVSIHTSLDKEVTWPRLTTIQRVQEIIILPGWSASHTGSHTRRADTTLGQGGLRAEQSCDLPEETSLESSQSVHRLDSLYVYFQKRHWSHINSPLTTVPTLQPEWKTGSLFPVPPQPSSYSLVITLLPAGGGWSQDGFNLKALLQGQ